MNASKLVCVCYARLTCKSGGHGSQPLVRGFQTTVSDLYVRLTRGATGMTTTPVDSEGTRSAPSPMVAVPGVGETPLILGTGIGMTMPKILAPRAVAGLCLRRLALRV